MALPGEVRILPDVPAAFAALVASTAPRSIALSGGELAAACYTRLAQAALDWTQIEVYFGDDRYQPAEHVDSNEGMARRVLLDHVQPRAVYPMVQGRSIEDAADAYDRLIRAAPPIQLVHLGLGPDGHTASLFPGTAAVEERERYVVANADDLHPHARLTFTFPAIARSPLVVVTVSGADKREAIDQIRAGADLPGARIRGGRVLWLGDEAALGTA